MGQESSEKQPYGDRAPSRSLRVLHAPTEIAGQVATLVRALRELGYDASGVSFLSHKHEYGTLKELSPSDRATLASKSAYGLRVLADAIRGQDIVHFHTSYSLLPLNMDVVTLRALGPAAVVHFWGSDVRILGIAGRNNPWVHECLNAEDDSAKRRRIRWLGTWMTTAIVGDYELYDYVAEDFIRVEVVPQAIDLLKYQAHPPNPNSSRPKVVHAPSNPAMKGTGHILRVVQRLRREMDFDFELISGKKHAEAIAAIAEADIVVDQLLVGAYGILAVEAMALAKPVICYIRDDLRDRYPARLPIMSATPASVEEVLRSLLTDAELRHRIGLEGRRYVETFHGALDIARRLGRLYEALAR